MQFGRFCAIVRLKWDCCFTIVIFFPTANSQQGVGQANRGSSAAWSKDGRMEGAGRDAIMPRNEISILEMRGIVLPRTALLSDFRRVLESFRVAEKVDCQVHTAKTKRNTFR